MTIPDLKKNIKNASKPSVELLQTALDTCIERKKTFEQIMSDIGGLHETIWIDFANNNPQITARAPDVEPDEEYIDAKSVIDPNLYIVRRNDDYESHQLYPIEDPSLKIVGKPLDFDSLNKSKLTDLAMMFNNTLALEGIVLKKPVKSGRANSLIDEYFSTIATTNPMPTPYAQPNDDVFCRARRTIEPDAAGNWDGWKNFGSGFEDFEAYAAKIYAIMFGKDTSRQALVTRSDGKTGKSCAAEAIASIIGNDDVAKVITGTHVSHSSRFLASHYVNAAFIYAPDCNVKTFLLSEVVKQLTGSDKVMFEVKGGAYGQFDPRGKKLMVNMNPRPLILSEEHSRSRILYLEQRAIAFSDIGNAAYTQLLKDQLPGFLAFGERCFADRWRNHMVTLNDRAQSTFDSLVGSDRQDFYDFVARHLVLADCEDVDDQSTMKLTSSEFGRLLDKAKISQHDRPKWREWLEDFEGVSRFKETANGNVTYTGISTKMAAATNTKKAGVMNNA